MIPAGMHGRAVAGGDSRENGGVASAAESPGAESGANGADKEGFERVAIEDRRSGDAEARSAGPNRRVVVSNRRDGLANRFFSRRIPRAASRSAAGARLHPARRRLRLPSAAGARGGLRLGLFARRDAVRATAASQRGVGATGR